MPTNHRPVFSSRLGMLLTMIGVSVGLGNVWRFPYMMGSHGGSAFLLVYLSFVLLLAVPALTAEWTLGRTSRRGPMGAFPRVFGPRWGRLVGYLLLLTVLVADSYYIVVIGQIVITGGFTLYPGFSAETWPVFEVILGSSAWQYLVSMVILLLSLLTIRQGLNRGIERISRVFVPFFGAVMVYLIVTALSQEGALDHLADFLRPEFSALSATDWFAALGQAFFSLGLGGTFFVIYGSYLPDDQPLLGAALGTALGDTGAALMAGLFIVPAALVFSLDMAQGPGLLFDTLPHLFAVMPGGRILGGLFLIGLSMVAFLSNIAALEVAAAGLRDRPQAPPLEHILIAIGVVEAFLIFASTWNNNLIGTLDLIFGSGMQVTGSLFAVIAVGWVLDRALVQQQIFGRSGGWRTVFRHWIQWAIPLSLLAILLGYIYSSLI